ncbi:MAG: hypothetical protein ACI9OJ_004449 [Myxococcota bacterium]|jgi:hypothetical protein
MTRHPNDRSKSIAASPASWQPHWMRTPPLFLFLVPLLLFSTAKCPTAAAHPPPLAERVRIHVAATGNYLNWSVELQGPTASLHSVEVEVTSDDASFGFEIDADFPFGQYLAVSPLVSMRFSDLEDPKTGGYTTLDLGGAIRVGLPVLGGRGWMFVSLVAGGWFVLPNDIEDSVESTPPLAWFFGLGVGLDWQVTDSIGIITKLEWRGRWRTFNLDVAHGSLAVDGVLVGHAVGLGFGLTFLP